MAKDLRNSLHKCIRVGWLIFKQRKMHTDRKGPIYFGV